MSTRPSDTEGRLIPFPQERIEGAEFKKLLWEIERELLRVYEELGYVPGYLVYMDEEGKMGFVTFGGDTFDGLALTEIMKQELLRQSQGGKHG